MNRQQVRQNHYNIQGASNSSFGSGRNINVNPYQSSYLSAFRSSDNFSRGSIGSPRHYQSKDLSLGGINPTKPRFSQRVSYQPKPDCSTNSESMNDSYQSIQRILKNENLNLKDQNKLLLRQVNRLKQSNRKYKQEYENARREIEGVRLECQAHKRRADQMKNIILNRLSQFQQKVKCAQMVNLTNTQLDNSIVDVLMFSESQII